MPTMPASTLAASRMSYLCCRKLNAALQLSYCVAPPPNSLSFDSGKCKEDVWRRKNYLLLCGVANSRGPNRQLRVGVQIFEDKTALTSVRGHTVAAFGGEVKAAFTGGSPLAQVYSGKPT